MVNDYLVIDPHLRTITIPESELTFGVESDLRSERKYFQCPRYVGNNIDLASCFVRVNFRNANGDLDAYLVEDLVTDGDNVTFSWELTSKVTQFKGQVAFVVCACRPTTGSRIVTEWNTTVGYGVVLEGLEPDTSTIDAETSDVVAQLLAMVEEQTELVRTEGASQVTNIRAVTTTSIEAVETAAETAQSDAVTEIEAKGVNTLGSIPDDYTALSEAVDSLTRGRAGAIVCEVASASVVVSDSSNLPIQGLRLFGKSTQDGVPTPEAPVEIKSVESPVVTVAGSQLISTPYYSASQEKNGVTFTVSEDGSLRVIGTATSKATFYFVSGSPIYKGQYFLSGCPAGGSMSGYSLRLNLIIDGEEVTGATDVGNGAKVSIESENILMKLYFVVLTGTTVDLTVYPILNVGDSAKPYCLAKPKQNLAFSTNSRFAGIPVTSGGNYTDADGQQWICDEIDLERGVYVQRIGTATYTGESTEYVSTYGLKDSGFAVSRKSNDYMLPTASDQVIPAFCDKLTAVSTADIYSLAPNGTFAFSTGGNVIRFSLDVLSGFNVDEVRSWLTENPLTFMYMLATPIEAPLSESEIAAYRELHSNYPNTTVLNDSGAHMVVKYAADTKLYIDNKIKEVLA